MINSRSFRYEVLLSKSLWLHCVQGSVTVRVKELKMLWVRVWHSCSCCYYTCHESNGQLGLELVLELGLGIVPVVALILVMCPRVS